MGNKVCPDRTLYEIGIRKTVQEIPFLSDKHQAVDKVASTV